MSIILATEVAGAVEHVFRILSTTDGQRAFWTADCNVSADRARFGFPGVPVNLETDVTAEPNALVRMRVRSGFPFWVGSSWEWELGQPTRGGATSVLFRHYGFEDGYSEVDLGHTAETWALILDRLTKFVATGEPQPFFPTSS